MKKYKSEALASVHDLASGMHRAGLIDDKRMRSFDASCLTPVKKMTADEIRALREREDASQEVFAFYLGVTKGLVSQWERGEKHPRGASLKLLALVEKNGLSWAA